MKQSFTNAVRITLFAVGICAWASLFGCMSGPNYGGSTYDSAAESAKLAEQAAPSVRSAIDKAIDSPNGVDERSSSAVAVIPDEKKIIWTADVRCQVSNHAKARAKIAEIVKKSEAYISNDNEINNSYSIESNITVRVTSEKFRTLVDELVSVASYVDYKNISSNDVTAEYIDLAARLKTKKEVELRFRELLSRSKSVEDILAVENQLKALREEIESVEGRLKYLENQTTLSTIHIAVYERMSTIPPAREKFISRIIKATKVGWEGLLAFIVGLFYAWPFFVLMFLLIIILRGIIKARKKRKARAAAAKIEAEIKREL